MRFAATWCISLVSIALVLIRPKAWPEAIWAISGALLLVFTGLLAPAAAWNGVAKGLDVYLFLTGMMLISELARREGVFDWLAVRAVRASKGSSARLFALIYVVGVLVTVFLSNDATAVVLTPAVLAAVRKAEAEPRPYLMSCAFIANAASFVLPISNPANLVVFRDGLPPLKDWLVTFGVPSLVAIVITFVMLLVLARPFLRGPVKSAIKEPPLSAGGRLTLYGTAVLAGVLLTASALHRDLGLPACLTGMAVALAIALRDRQSVFDAVRGVAWSVLPLVAGLFAIVEALDGVGALQYAIRGLDRTPLIAGFTIALISNAINNLPSGLIAAAAIQVAHLTGALRAAILIGVDLGPNLSVTGSLATVLWLMAIRREGLTINFWSFLKWGICVMPPALLLAIVALR